MAVIIHSGLSYPTRLAHSWFPDPLFRIFIDSIHKAKVCGLKEKDKFNGLDWDLYLALITLTVFIVCFAH